jgi:hypothetical protein
MKEMLLKYPKGQAKHTLQERTDFGLTCLVAEPNPSRYRGWKFFTVPAVLGFPAAIYGPIQLL